MEEEEEESDDYYDYDDDDDPSSVHFPPIVGADDVAHFFSTYDLDGLHWALSNVYRRRGARHRRRHHGKRRGGRELPAAIVSRGGGNAYTSEYKLRHDLGQAHYLANILDSTDESHRVGVLPGCCRARLRGRARGGAAARRADVDGRAVRVHERGLRRGDRGRVQCCALLDDVRRDRSGVEGTGQSARRGIGLGRRAGRGTCPRRAAGRDGRLRGRCGRGACGAPEIRRRSGELRRGGRGRAARGRRE